MFIRKKIILIFMALGFIFILNGCVVAPHGHYPPPRGQVSLMYWYYYPNYGVYYQPDDNYYYYSIGGVWRRSTSLPSGWVIRDEPRVRLHLSGVPYRKYTEHRRQFPPRRVVHPGRRPGNDDRHDNRRRPDYDDRRPGNSRDHQPDRDRKQDRNIFVPHTKDERKFDRRPDYDNRDQRYKGSSKEENKGVIKGLKQRLDKKESPKSRSKGKPPAKKYKKRDRYEKDKRERKGDDKRRSDEEDDSDSHSGDNPERDSGGLIKGLGDRLR